MSLKIDDYLPQRTNVPSVPSVWTPLQDVPGTTTATTPPPGEAERSVEECLLAWRQNRAGRNLPEIEDTVDLLTLPAEQPKVLIDGILHQGSKMIIGSGSKSFKTWTLLDLAMSVASGVPWLGLSTTAGKVLFLNFELKPASVRSRMEAIKKARDIHWDKGTFDLWNLRGHAAEYSVVIPKIIERVKSRQYDLIILDPVYKLYGDTDENSAGDVAMLMNELERLALQTNAAIVFSAHFSKGNQAGKESVDRVSGSGVFARDPDAILSFTKHEQDNAFVVESTLRDFKQMAPFVVKWEYPLLVRAEKLNPDKLKTSLMKKSKYTADDLLGYVVEKAITTKELKKVAMEELGVSKSFFYELLADLRRMSEVTYSEQTGTLSYTVPKQTPGDSKK
ncbi:MAG: hypothetical protein JWM16_2510 [Verrucomicrobiales bacterium]|nr:hypothetical protein [Verrucomicrobiales bacterium]